MKKLVCLIMAICMLLAGTAFAEQTSISFNFAALADLDFYFASGVGGWFTELHIAEDGSFTGLFSDTDMGDSGEDYPDGTVFGCTFSGQLKLTECVNFNTYRFHQTLTLDEGQVPETIEDGVRYVTVDTPYGLENTDELLLYLPGTPLSELPEEFLMWAHLEDMGDDLSDTLPCYGLFNPAEGQGFVGYPAFDDENPEAV